MSAATGRRRLSVHSSRTAVKNARRLRGGVWLGPLGVVMLLGLALVIGLNSPSAPPAAASAPELQAYANAVARTAAPAGQVVEIDMKPSVRSWQSGALPGDVLAARAGAWALTFGRTRSALMRITPPAGMTTAQAGFLSSLDRYAAAADLFRAAASAPAAGQQAIAAAKDADARYAAASAILQRALRAAGLSPDIRFPPG